MKLSTRSRYGTRLILDMAKQNSKTPIQLGEIARRQNISLKYLEQIIRPLKRANYIKSFRGSKGGHLLNRNPEDITVGEVVALLEGSTHLTACSNGPKSCNRSDECLTRFLWMEASQAFFNRLNQITFADLLATARTRRSKSATPRDAPSDPPPGRVPAFAPAPCPFRAPPPKKSGWKPLRPPPLWRRECLLQHLRLNGLKVLAGLKGGGKRTAQEDHPGALDGFSFKPYLKTRFVLKRYTVDAHFQP